MDYDSMIKQVADRTGLDREHAERATKAVLETLGQRLAGGEPKDLGAQLPGELGELLSRHANAPAVRFDADEFVRRVSDAEGCAFDEARSHVMVVFSVVRDCVTGGEWKDVLSQLPSDIRSLAAEDAV